MVSLPAEWSVSPKHLLRQSCIADALAEYDPGSFFEAGAGSGHLTGWLASQGFHGYASDLGSETQSHLKKALLQTNVAVVASAADCSDNVQFLFAFEVLEHIEADAEALRSWMRVLQDDGTVIFSVPAHRRKFSVADEAVGHVRRYDRTDVAALAESAGLTISQIDCYGFPLSALSRRAEALLNRIRRPSTEGTAIDRSIDSGVKRSKAARLVSLFLTPTSLIPFLWLQRRFYQTDLGDGFVVTATRQ